MRPGTSGTYLARGKRVLLTCSTLAVVVSCETEQRSLTELQRQSLAPTAAWPNEPPGFTPITDQPWDSLTSDGWAVAWNDSGYVSVAQDATAPMSPPDVSQFMYPNGHLGGQGVGASPYHDLGTTVWTVYTGFWWKPSNP